MASERLQPTSVSTRSEAEERCKAQADAMLLQKARTKAAKQLYEFQGILEQGVDAVQEALLSDED